MEYSKLNIFNSKPSSLKKVSHIFPKISRETFPEQIPYYCSVVTINKMKINDKQIRNEAQAGGNLQSQKNFLIHFDKH